MNEPKKEWYIGREEMLLPDGKHCSDCQNFKRCEMFIGSDHINDKSIACDWSPSRFKQAVQDQSEA